jgi:hypothetical protein
MLCNLGSAASTLELFLLVVCKIDKKNLFDLKENKGNNAQ